MYPYVWLRIYNLNRQTLTEDKRCLEAIHQDAFETAVIKSTFVFKLLHFV